MKNWALVIGVNQYRRMRPLRFALRDAQLMRNYFLNEAGFDRVFYFADDSPDIEAPDGSLQSTRSTFGNLYSFLLDFFESPNLEAGDNFWFFFSGHGQREGDRDYLMLADSNPRDVERTAIALNYVTERLRRCGADNVILLLDACRSEDRAGLGIGLETQQGVVTLFSCSPRERSWEISALKQGAFTYALLEALRIQGEGNCATVERLYQHLRRRVAEINQAHQYERQTPYAVVEPATKYHLILLPRQATLNDINALKMDALKAEVERDYELARQLWIRVNVAAMGSDMEVITAFSRLATQGLQPPAPTPSPATSRSTPTQEKPPTTEKADKETHSSALARFEFEFITVNARGKRINQESRQAEYFREDLGNGISLDMVAIPGGKFLMGTEDKEIERLVQKYNWDGFRRERPQHEVTFRPFFMGKYPVTQAQWRVVAAFPKVNCDLEPDPSRFKGENLPVEQVSWFDAVEFCDRLSRHTQKTYRLPSESEWEYACRAGTTTPFHFDETLTSALANYRTNSTYAEESKGEYRQQTTPVESFPPNPFGLFNMHGNVLEWCMDRWHNNYQGAPTDGSPWLEFIASESSRRAIRGGSWDGSPRYCRCAFRIYPTRDLRSYDIGFRVACGGPRIL